MQNSIKSQKFLYAVRPICWMFFFWGFGLVYSQNGLCKRITTDDGLPMGTVQKMVRDEYGILWIGTPDGIYSYDGKEFKKIEPVFEDGFEVDPFVGDLKLHGNRVFVSARNCVWYYDRVKDTCFYWTEKTRHFSYGHSLDIKDTANILFCTALGVYELYISDNDQIKRKDAVVIRSQSRRGFYINNGFVFQTEQYFLRVRNQKIDTMYYSPVIRDIGYDTVTRNYVLHCVEGLVTGTPEKGFKTLPVKLNYNKVNPYHPMSIDKKGNVWLVCSDSVLRFNLRDFSTEWMVPNRKNPYGYSLPNPLCVYPDDPDNLWIGSSGNGIYYHNQTDHISFISKQEIDDTPVWYIYPANKNTLLVGTNKGLSSIDIHTKKTDHLTPGLKVPFASITPYRDNSYLAATYKADGVYEVNENNGVFTVTGRIKTLDSTSVRYMEKIGNDTWVAASNRGIIVYTPHSTHFFKESPCFIPGSDLKEYNMYSVTANDTYILVGASFGLYVLDKSFRLKRAFNRRAGEKNVLSAWAISDARFLGDDYILFGSYGGGLYVGQISTGNLKRVHLSNNPTWVYKILEVNHHWVISTNVGIYVLMNDLTLKFIISRKNKLPFNDFNQFSGYVDPDTRQIYLGGEQGIVMLDPGFVLQDRIQNELYIKWKDPHGNYHIENQLRQKISFPASQRKVDLEVFYKRWDIQEDLPVMYRTGDSKEGILLEGKHIVLDNLSAGSHKIYIELNDPDQLTTSCKIELEVYIQPYFYETLIFKIVSVIFILVLIFFSARYISLYRIRRKLEKLRSEKKLQDEKIRISKELHDNIGSQLTYLTIGLDTSQKMLENNRGDEATVMLNKLKETARESTQELRNTVWAMNREKMTLETLIMRYTTWASAYLEVKPGINFTSAFSVDISSEMDAITALNVFRILQEALQNSLKHSEATGIYFEVKKAGTKIEFVFTDDGKGMDLAAVKRGEGLIIMQNRAQFIGAKLTVESEPGNGTRLNLTYELNH